jgi:hypothetical protein
MTDDELMRVFEAGKVPDGGFHHEQHVRVAWNYLKAHSLPEALARFCSALKGFAHSQGAPNLYHETITVAFMSLVAQRVASRPGLPWDAFVAAWPDLMERALLSRWYARETLESALARAVFVLPDVRTEGA